MYKHDRKVLNDVSFSLCVLNFHGVCQQLDPASGSSPSPHCGDGDLTLRGVCSLLCPSPEPLA